LALWVISLLENQKAAKTGVALALLAVLLAGVMPAQEQSHVYRMPFHETHGRIILDATVDGRPVPVLFDTGAAMSFSLVRRGHPIILVLRHDGPRFETAEREERCPSFSVPEIRVDGFVGTDVLKGFRAVRINFTDHVIELEKKP
jgi:hypothetical protein